MIPSAGEVWLAERGEAQRRRVVVISDTRFHRLSDRAVVAPVVDRVPAAPMPWHIPVDGGVIAVNQIGSIPLDRLLERVETTGISTIRQVRRAVREITN